MTAPTAPAWSSPANGSTLTAGINAISWAAGLLAGEILTATPDETTIAVTSAAAEGGDGTLSTVWQRSADGSTGWTDTELTSASGTIGGTTPLTEYTAYYLRKKVVDSARPSDPAYSAVYGPVTTIATFTGTTGLKSWQEADDLATAEAGSVTSWAAKGSAPVGALTNYAVTNGGGAPKMVKRRWMTHHGVLLNHRTSSDMIGAASTMGTGVTKVRYAFIFRYLPVQYFTGGFNALMGVSSANNYSTGGQWAYFSRTSTNWRLGLMGAGGTGTPQASDFGTADSSLHGGIVEIDLTANTAKVWLDSFTYASPTLSTNASGFTSLALGGNLTVGGLHHSTGAIQKSTVDVLMAAAWTGFSSSDFDKVADRITRKFSLPAAAYARQTVVVNPLTTPGYMHSGAGWQRVSGTLQVDWMERDQHGNDSGSANNLRGGRIATSPTGTTWTPGGSFASTSRFTYMVLKVPATGTLLRVSRGVTVGTVYDFGIERSTDGGETWGATYDLQSHFYNKFNWPWGGLTQLPSGRIIWACYGGTTTDTTYRAFALYSDDDGQTWAILGNIAGTGSTTGWAEPAIARLASGNLICILRQDTPGTHTAWRSISTNNGATWSSPVEMAGASGRSLIKSHENFLQYVPEDDVLMLYGRGMYGSADSVTPEAYWSAGCWRCVDGVGDVWSSFELLANSGFLTSSPDTRLGVGANATTADSVDVGIGNIYTLTDDRNLITGRNVPAASSGVVLGDMVNYAYFKPRRFH